MIPANDQMATPSTVCEERRVPRRRPIMDEATPLYRVWLDARRTLSICGREDLPARAEENRLFFATAQAPGHEHIAYLQVASRAHGTVVSRIRESGDAVAQAIRDFVHSAQR